MLLIVVVVLMFAGFPRAFSAMMTALHVPVTLMLIGIVLRGSAFDPFGYTSERRLERRLISDYRRLLDRLLGRDSSVAPSLDSESIRALSEYANVDEEVLLAAVLYNSHLWTALPDERIRNSLSGAVAYFQAKRPLDVLEALKGSKQSGALEGSGKSAPPPVQITKAKSVRIAGRDIHEAPKRSPKD